MIDHYSSKARVKFNKGCLKQSNKLTNDYGSRVNIYIAFELGASNSNDSNPTLKNCLFSAVTLTKNADIEKYGYSGYGIRFDRRTSFSFPGGGFCQNILAFGVDMISSAHIYNKKKNILLLGIGPTQGLEHTLIANSYLFVNGTEIYKFKVKDSETVVGPICLGNISKDWSVDNLKKS